MRSYFAGLLLLACHLTTLLAQGPPITLDKPITTGGREGTFRANYRYYDNARRDFSALMLSGEYNLTQNLAFGADMPLVYDDLNGVGVGDVRLSTKVQLYTQNSIGKTFRVAATARQTFATGRKNLETPVLGMGNAMSYVGLLAARETLKLGLAAELGYGYVPGNTRLSRLGYKLGVGLPLLEPIYPVKQLNLFVETEGMHLPRFEGDAQYGLYAAPGIQFAKGRYTFDASVQFPLNQQLQGSPGLERRLQTLVGFRVIL